MEYFFLLIPLAIVVIFIIAIKLSMKTYSHFQSDRIMRKALSSRDNLRNPKSDDFLSRNQKKEKEIKEKAETKNLNQEQKDIIEANVVKYDPLELSRQEETKIVGIAEPKGFWSRFVMSQKLGYIMARLTQQNSKESGFWVNLIKAQSLSQGKDQGKGR